MPLCHVPFSFLNKVSVFSTKLPPGFEAVSFSTLMPFPIPRLIYVFRNLQFRTNPITGLSCRCGGVKHEVLAWAAHHIDLHDAEDIARSLWFARVGINQLTSYYVCLLIMLISLITFLWSVLVSDQMYTKNDMDCKAIIFLKKTFWHCTKRTAIT